MMSVAPSCVCRAALSHSARSEASSRSDAPSSLSTSAVGATRRRPKRRVGSSPRAAASYDEDRLRPNSFPARGMEIVGSSTGFGSTGPIPFLDRTMYGVHGQGMTPRDGEGMAGRQKLRVTVWPGIIPVRPVRRYPTKLRGEDLIEVDPSWSSARSPTVEIPDELYLRELLDLD